MEILQALVRSASASWRAACRLIALAKSWVSWWVSLWRKLLTLLKLLVGWRVLDKMLMRSFWDSDQWINMILLKWNIQTDPLPTSDPRPPRPSDALSCTQLLPGWWFQAHSCLFHVLLGPLVVILHGQNQTRQHTISIHVRLLVIQYFKSQGTTHVKNHCSCPRIWFRKKTVTPIFQSYTPDVLWNLHAFKVFL